MPQEGNYFEFEIKVRDISLRVRGSEEFVKENLEKSNEILTKLIEMSSTLPPIQSQYHAGSNEGESDKSEKPPLPSTPPDGIAESDWRWRIAKDAGVSFDTIDVTLKEDGGLIMVDDWNLEGEIEEKIREVAIIAMYANSIFSGGSEFTTYNITKSLQHLRIEYNHRTISTIICEHSGLRSPRSKWLKINHVGLKAAKDFLSERQRELER